MANSSPNSRFNFPFAGFLVVLALLELVWLGWFLYVPLPNAANIGGNIQRWLILGKALPEVIPGVRFRHSYLGQAWNELSHVENLPQRVPIILGAAGIAWAAVALGRWIVRGLKVGSLSPWERLPLAFGLGMTGLGVATLIVGRLGLLGPWPFRIGLGVLIAADVLYSLATWRRPVDPEFAAVERAPPKASGVRAVLPWLGFGVVAGPFLVIMALGAMLPTIDFDATEYHLQGPKEYCQAGRIAFLPHNVYTSMPFGVEMLHLLGMEVMDDWWSGALAGQLLVACFAPMTAALVALTATRLGSPRAGWIAAFVYLTTPWIYRLAVIPYVEGPLCYYHAALVWVVSRQFSVVSHQSSSVRHWLLLGLLAGGAMACKYPALISAVVPFGFLAFIESGRRRSWRIVGAYVLGWAVVMAPWLGKNVIDTGNPVYPLAYRVFGGTHWDARQDAKWSHAHARKPVTFPLLIESVVDVAGRSDWQSSLYVALAPLSLLRPGSRRRVGLLWSYAAYLFLTWWLFTHRLDRFWLPMLSTLAVLAGLGADWSRRLGWSIVLGVLMTLAFVTNLAYNSTALAGLNEWTADLQRERTRIPRTLNRPLATLDAVLPDEARVLLVGQAGVFHFRHRIVYNTVFNQETFETLTRGRSPDDVRREFRRLGVTHVYVDWFEIERYRSPGNYGFTDYVTPELFDRLIAAGVLKPPVLMGSRQELYAVR